jgi:hypothetical protein
MRLDSKNRPFRGIAMQFMLVEEAIQLIEMEYAEMPGLSLTFWQAQRLWNLSDELCERALGTLVKNGFLTMGGDDAYVRPTVIHRGKNAA